MWDMDTDLLYVANREHDFYECTRRTLKKWWRYLRNGDFLDEFSANSTTIFSLVLAALSIRSTIDENLGYSKKNYAAQKRFACVAKNIAVMTHNQTNSNLAAKA